MRNPPPDAEGHDVVSYLALADCGILAPDDRVELLHGVVVAMPPPSPLLDGIVHHVQALLQRKLGTEALVRARGAFLAGPRSLAQPAVAVLPGRNSDYLRRHPSRAHLLVEVSDSTLPQDRITKAAIYARAGVAVYWILNLRDGTVECFRMPDQMGRRYMQATRATGSERLPLDAYPEAWIEARELFPEETGR